MFIPSEAEWRELSRHIQETSSLGCGNAGSSCSGGGSGYVAVAPHVFVATGASVDSVGEVEAPGPREDIVVLWVNFVLHAAAKDVLELGAAIVDRQEGGKMVECAYEVFAFGLWRGEYLLEGGSVHETVSRRASRAYVVLGSVSRCNASRLAVSLQPYARRLLRDVLVWRCCSQVGFGCRDTLIREFGSAFEAVEDLQAPSDPEKDLVAQLFLSYSHLTHNFRPSDVLLRKNKKRRVRNAKSKRDRSGSPGLLQPIKVATPAYMRRGAPEPPLPLASFKHTSSGSMFVRIIDL